MTDANRKRLTTLVAAGTKLDAAARLLREAAIDIESTGLLPREFAYNSSTDVDVLVQRVVHAIDLIP